MTPEETVDRYCAAWNEPDPERRRALLREAWDPGARYADPTADVTGVDALAAHIGNVHATYPGARIERLSAVDLHHDVLRFAWRMVLGDGQALPDGIDFGQLGPDGKLTRIIGFFGPVKAL
jgi:SnoaL-like domain